MKQLFSFLLGAGLLAAVAAQASLPSPDLMARVHFAGAEQISADTNAIAFTNLWCSPEARALRDQTLGKLSRAPGAWFKSKIPAGASDGAAQLRPLLDDLLSAEWFLQLRDTTNGSPEFALAIRLNAGRAQLWSTNLAAVFQMWTGIPAAQGQSGDWELKKHRPPNLIRFARAGDWVVFGGGQDKLPLSEELVRRILSDKRPAPAEKNDWLAVDLDWPRLARWFPALRVVDLPEARWQFTGRNGNLHLDGKVIFLFIAGVGVSTGTAAAAVQSRPAPSGDACTVASSCLALTSTLSAPCASRSCRLRPLLAMPPDSTAVG